MRKRINLEVFHALTDGLGAVNFLKCLIRQYLRLAAGVSEGMTQDDEKARNQEVFHVQDSYLEHGEDGKPPQATARNRHTSWKDIIFRWEVVRSCMVMCR